MEKSSRPAPKTREIISKEKVDRGIADLTAFILKKLGGQEEDFALVGIQRRGAVLVDRIAKTIQKDKDIDVCVGALDITLYRDDFSTSGIQPIVGETHLDFDLNNKKIILVDDVLFTGRTIRAAIDELMDFGRPRSITLAVLIDRGHRELPIQPDFSALTLATKRNESVNLHLQEIDKDEEIVIYEAASK